MMKNMLFPSGMTQSMKATIQYAITKDINLLSFIASRSIPKTDPPQLLKNS